MDHQFPSTDPLFVSDVEEMTQEMEYRTNSPGAFSEGTNMQHNSLGPTLFFNQGAFGKLAPHLVTSMRDDLPLLAAGPLPFSEQPRPQNFNHSHHRHPSSSSQSTQFSGYRSSNGSALSGWQQRSSVASTDTTWSHLSDNSRSQGNAPPGLALDTRFAYTSPPSATSNESSAVTSSPSNTSQRQSPQDKEPPKTCVSRARRTRRSQNKHRYWCTACGEGFGEKYDWKRHEETYQERFEQYCCNLCGIVYFLAKDFQNHHTQTHKCKLCIEGQHSESARSARRTRTGWGCGFCTHLSVDWKERCDHIGRHFENGKTMADWHHSHVIWSLLQRAELIVPFSHLMNSSNQLSTGKVRWEAKDTGRADGYPDANVEPKLQDLLEFYTPNQNPEAIVHLAFNMNRQKRGSSRSSNLAPPPVPEKNHIRHHSPQYPAPPPPPQYAPPPPPDMHDSLDDITWDTFLHSIPEDTNLPTSNIAYEDIFSPWQDISPVYPDF